MPPGRASTGPGHRHRRRRRHFRRRHQRDRGLRCLDHPWTAPPGRASTTAGRCRCRAGPRLARDGAAGPGLDWPGTAGGRGLFGAQGCAGSPAVSENVCGMSVTALQQEEPPARTRNPEPGPGNLARQGGETCAHLSSNEKNLRTLETEPRKICALSENVHKIDVHTHRNTEKNVCTLLKRPKKKCAHL